MARAEQLSSGYRKYLLAFYYAATAKFSLSLAVFGLLLVATGPVFEAYGASGDYFHGVHPMDASAGIVPVVGASFFVAGITIYLVLLISRKIDEMSE